jgi:hypothetical protein
MIPYDRYLELMRVDEAEVLARFERLQRRMKEANREYSEADVEADLKEATQLVRSRKRKR